MRPQAVIFDIGNVLLKFDYYIAANRLMEKNNLKSLPERSVVVEAKAALEGGKIDRAKFLSVVRPHFCDFGTDEEFLRIWEDIFEENIPMTQLASALSNTIPTYLLSNISCIHHDYIFKTFPVFQTFRDGVFSYQAGSLKPDAAIYLTAIRQFGIQPESTVFIDDMAENILSAKQLGFMSVHYDFNRHDTSVKILQGFGLSV